MAAGDEYLSLVGKDGLNELELFKKSARELGDIVIDANGKVAALYGKFKDTKSMKEFNKQYDEARKLVDDLNASTKAYEKSLADEAKQRALNAKAIQEEEKAKQQKLKTDAIGERGRKKELSDYQLLSKAYLDARDKYRSYLFVLGEGHELTKQAADDANKLNAALKRVDATTGEFRRNVGNYNEVGSQFNQLLREAPNFAQSLRVGVQSLTNNVTYFGEAIARARAEGQSWSVILGNVKQSLVGLVGVMNLLTLGIVLVVNNWEKLSDFFTNSGEAARKQQRYIDGFAASLDNLRKKSEDLSDSINNTYDVDIAKAKALGESEEQITKRKLDEIDKRYIANQKYILSLKKNLEDAKKYGQELIDTEADDEAFEKQVSNVRAIEEEIRRATKDSDRFKSQYLVTYYDNEARKLEAAKNNVEDFTNTDLALQERLNKALAEKRKIDLEDSINKNLAVIDDDKNSLDARLDAIVQYFESKRALNNIDMNSELSSIQYKLDKITEIEGKAANKRTKQERALLREKEVLEAEKTAIVAKYAIKEADITADANKKEKAAVDKAITDAENAEKRKQEGLLSIRIAAGKSWQKIQEDEFKAEQKKTQERIKLLGQLRDAANQIFGAIEDISQNKFERDMERLNMQEEAIDRETQVKLNALEKQGLSEEEYDQRKAEVEARADQRKQLLAQNEAARQERQADFEKGMAILKATLALYIGIAQEIEKGGAIGIATGAAVAAYMATVIATLASTPTPQYGDGTPIGGHKGGDAIIGERYEPEQVTLPSGQQYIVSTPTYVKNLPVGTDVTPLSHMVGYKGRPVARGQYGDAQALVNAVENGVSKGLSKQPVHKTVLTNSGLRYVVKNGNTQTTYFNANNA